METPPPPPPPQPPNFSLFHSPTTPTSTPSHPTPHRKKRTRKLLQDVIDAGKPANKKPDPAAPKITRPCTECGKKFWSWKALFGHMRCHPERQWRGINPPPHLRRPLSPPTPDDHDVAASLLMLASSSTTTITSPLEDAAMTSAKFECSSCKKTFGSHQALGGHRASHKNVKGCFAINNKPEDQQLFMNMIMEAHNQNEVADVDLGLGLGLGLGFGLAHKCGICLRVFSSGQALGGHMRCHWEQHSQPSSPSFGPGFSPISGSRVGQCSPDLNLPAPLWEEMQLDLRLGL